VKSSGDNVSPFGFWQCPFAHGWYGTECDFINSSFLLMEVCAQSSRMFKQDKARGLLLDVKECCWKGNVK